MGLNPNEKFMNLQNRNDLCNCGSGKKFKKCCETVFELTNDESYFKIVRGDIDNRVLDIKNSIKWRTSIVNLPDEIKNVVKEFIENENISYYGCYYNSFLLSLYDNRIKTIKGWYGIPMSKEMIEETKTSLEEINFTGRFYKQNDNEGRFYIDTENWIQYLPHSWNEIDGITFDLTTESNPTFDKWIYYVKTETINLNRIISNNKILEYYTNKSKVVLNRIKNKFGVNNSNLMNQLNFDYNLKMVG